MDGDRTRAIIGIFGSTEPQAITLARELGAEVAGRGHIVLSGGTGLGDTPVKESAIQGAGASPWIGVDPDGPVAVEPKGAGLVIHTGLGHKRNYLEAHMCDAAIGLKGGPGTVSEVTFAVALGRPTALVRESWATDGYLDGATGDLFIDTMFKVSFDRVRKDRTGIPGFDELLNEAAIREGLRRPGQHRYFPEATAAAVTDWIGQALSSSGLRGSFPPIEGYENVATVYQQWLDRQ
jgi:hypothetical protein